MLYVMSELCFKFRALKNSRTSMSKTNILKTLADSFYFTIFWLFSITLKETSGKIEKRAI